MDQIAKANLRGLMRRRRAALSAHDRALAAAAAADRLLRLKEVREASLVLVFYAFGSEVATADVLERLRAAGATVLLPRITPAGMEAAEATSLATTSYGPKEPSGPAVEPGAIDVVVVPGLAFDARGGRLGYGGGYYDRFLPRMRPQAARIGLAFSIQMVSEVPMDPWDERVDIVVTDKGVVAARPGPQSPTPL